MTALIPIHQASAAPEEPREANDQGSSHSNFNANNQGTQGVYESFNAHGNHFHEPPSNQPSLYSASENNPANYLT